MRSFARLVTRGMAALFLIFILVFHAPPALAQGEAPTLMTSGGIAGFLVIALGLGCLAATFFGVVSAGKRDAWPHWGSLVMGLGEAAFLVGLLASFASLRTVMMVIERFGAAATPSDYAGAMATALSTPILGTVAALIGLAGSTWIRWRTPLPGDPRVAAF